MTRHPTLLSIAALALSGSIVYSASAQYSSPRRATTRRTTDGRRSATEGRQASDDGSIKIRRLIGTGPQTQIRTPEFRTNVQKSGTRPQKWAQIIVEYDSAPEWIDTLTFRYFVMAAIKRDGERHYSLYEKTVEYIDVERDRRHKSSVFLRPATVKRQGEPVAVHVEVLIDGKVVATDDDVDASIGKLPLDWWENRTVLENPNTSVHNDRLLGRNQTPFALVNIDDYEVIR